MDVIDQSKHIETLRFLLFAFHYYLFCYSHGFSFSSWFVNFDKVIVFRDEVNKYSAEELMIMKTQDIGYVFQKWQSEKNVSYLSSYTPQELSAYDHIYPVFLFVPSYLLQKIDKLTASLQCTGDQSSRRHVYYAEDRLIPTFSPFFTWCSFRDFLIHFECVIWTLQNLILLTLTFKRHYRYHIVCVFL